MSGLRWTPEQLQEHLRKAVARKDPPESLTKPMIWDAPFEVLSQLPLPEEAFVRVVLPYPPSGNRQSRSGKRGHYTPPEVRKYRSQVAAEVAAVRGKEPMSGPLRMTLTLHPRRPKRPKPGREVRCIDLDNAQKVVSDALEHAGLFADDRRIVHATQCYGEPVPGGRVEVTVRREG